MLRKSLLILAALACAAAGPKPAPREHKPSAPAPAARPAGFDSRDPATLIALLATLNAEAKIVRTDGDSVFMAVTSPTEAFSVQFAGCDKQGHACQAMLFDRQGTEGQPTLPQINAFNQTSVMCRAYQEKGGRPHLEYSALVFPADGRAEMLMHINAWRGCIGDFTAFLKDPAGFLAGAA
jgi:hypothetical protein